MTDQILAKAGLGQKAEVSRWGVVRSCSPCARGYVSRWVKVGVTIPVRARVRVRVAKGAEGLVRLTAARSRVRTTVTGQVMGRVRVRDDAAHGDRKELKWCNNVQHDTLQAAGIVVGSVFGHKPRDMQVPESGQGCSGG